MNEYGGIVGRKNTRFPLDPVGVAAEIGAQRELGAGVKVGNEAGAVWKKELRQIFMGMNSRAGIVCPFVKRRIDMGLNERRKIKELQETVLPGRVKEIEEICGKPIPYEVDWASMSEDGTALNFVDNISCHRLNMALRIICQDDMGKQAVTDGLKWIKLRNVPDKAAKKLTFDKGTLEMACSYAQGLDGAFSDNEIRDLLIAKL
jgi:hypothetical protein